MITGCHVITLHSVFGKIIEVGYSLFLLLLLDDNKKFSILKWGIGIESEKIMEQSRGQKVQETNERMETS